MEEVLEKQETRRSLFREDWAPDRLRPQAAQPARGNPRLYPDCDQDFIDTRG